MYAFTHGQPLCLVYEDFYLAGGFTFYEFINFGLIISDFTKGEPDFERQD
jgi:hypothetical protein